MNKAEEDGKITGMTLTSSSPSIQHLLFADDSLFLCRASLRECTEFLKCLRLYGEASGQEINFAKSAVTFGRNIDPVMKRLLAEILGIEKEGGDGTYLGLPECFSGSKAKLLAFISEKLNKRLNGWYSKTLSLGGKEILLKSIAMALPVYAMSCFKLSKSQCQKITSAMSSFWWNACDKKRKIHWVSWEDLCKSKEKGGLGFRDVSNFNQALLAKQAWKLHNEPDSLLSRVYRGRYYSSSTFLECGKGYRPSYAWRSILHGKELLQRGLIRSIGNGKTTKIWTDKWIMDAAPRSPLSLHPSPTVTGSVDTLLRSDGTWNIDLLSSLFPIADIEKIVQLPIGEIEDKEIWAFSKSGSYSVKSGHWVLANATDPDPNPATPLELMRTDLKKRIWKIKTEPKIKFFWWRTVSGALAVADRLQTRGISTNPLCKLCARGQETINHVLFLCDVAGQIWSATHIPPPPTGYTARLEDNINYLLTLMQSNTIAENVKRIIPWVLWNIWKNRNEILLSQTQQTIARVAIKVMEDERQWREAQCNNTPADASTHPGIRLTNHWTRPPSGTVKCNTHADWRHPNVHSGTSWVARNQDGAVLFHARDAITPAPNRIMAELRCICWALQSLRELRFTKIIIASDCIAAVEAINKPLLWPRYCILLSQIEKWKQEFEECQVVEEHIHANQVARKIARSVTREGRYRSYLDLGGPAWLQNIIQQDSMEEP